MSMNEGTRVIDSPGLPDDYEPPSTAVTARPQQHADSCVFCEIVAGTAPAKIVRKWRSAIAFVPLSPVTDGHVLIVPKRHVAHAAENPQTTGYTAACAAEYAAQHDSFNLITSAGRAATQSIDHLHIHVVPRTVDDKLMTPWGTIYGDDPTAPHWCRVAQELQESVAARIRSRADRIGIENAEEFVREMYDPDRRITKSPDGEPRVRPSA